jgi:hypothetical protein
MVTKRETELEAKFAAANDAVDKALEARDNALDALMTAQFAYHDAIDKWSPLHDRMEAAKKKAAAPDGEAKQIGIDFGEDICRLLAEGKLIRSKDGSLHDAPGHTKASVAAFKRARDRCRVIGLGWNLSLSAISPWPEQVDGVVNHLARIKV